MNETFKTAQKRNIYLSNNFLLSNDSLTGETINPDFQAIDRGFYSKIKRLLNQNNNRETILINQLRKGQKINLRGVF